MRLLLDTHALIWALADPDRLPRPVRSAIESPRNLVFVSAASAWEIAIKSALGKIDFPLETLPSALETTHFAELPIGVRHAIRLKQLPRRHRDPFDRILIAQALVEALAVVTSDPVFRQYPVKSFWSP